MRPFRSHSHPIRLSRDLPSSSIPIPVCIHIRSLSCVLAILRPSLSHASRSLGCLLHLSSHSHHTSRLSVYACLLLVCCTLSAHAPSAATHPHSLAPVSSLLLLLACRSSFARLSRERLVLLFRQALLRHPLAEAYRSRRIRSLRCWRRAARRAHCAGRQRIPAC